MPAKKKAAAAAAPKQDAALSDSVARVRASSERNAKEAKARDAANRADRDATAARLAADQAALIEQPRNVKPDPEGDIDQRMAALLKDHQRMGVRQ